MIWIYWVSGEAAVKESRGKRAYWKGRSARPLNLNAEKEEDCGRREPSVGYKLGVSGGIHFLDWAAIRNRPPGRAAKSPWSLTEQMMPRSR